MRKVIVIFFFFFSCSEEKIHRENDIVDSVRVGATDSVAPTMQKPIIDPIKTISELEQKFIDNGLVNIHFLDSNIKVDLKYSSTDNFLGEDLYGELCGCYLQKEVVFALSLAQINLKKVKPEFSLLVFDCARPLSVQQLMWEKIPKEKWEKKKYLTNPKFGSLHNFGAALDASIIDENGNELDMGTKFDDFSELAYPIEEERFFQEGKLTNQQIENRKLLRQIMSKAGFFNIQTEWWHFNYCTREVAEERFKRME